ncbi:PREDICTED: coiled-coil domain-containing protein 124-like [Rhagoletis zephyria]|uniref:coiled-coil domain-containing protein 124-like n=2 Tax=Rhagoletis zephyria TaxID=28612 RepID=UPI0008112349|nr:PREDICTED: coiled-coil domain-containing protein 124-like [Rhagoletis zephyria]
MPKKMGTNSKAVEARERKQAVKQANNERAVKEAEDRLWQDNDRSLAKKQQRREEEEKKRAEALRRKAEAKALLDQEMSSIKTQGKQPLAKIHRQQILEEMEKKQRVIEAINAAKPQAGARIVLPEPVIEENLNRSMADVEIATNVDQALAALSVKDDEEDKHPEKRMRAAYRAFEAANLPRIKAENPSLRMTQWKQLLMKEWNKSPENPFNQAR